MPFVNPATARATRTSRRQVLSETNSIAAIAVDPRLLWLSDDDLRRRWERIATGRRS